MDAKWDRIISFFEAKELPIIRRGVASIRAAINYMDKVFQAPVPIFYFDPDGAFLSGDYGYICMTIADNIDFLYRAYKLMPAVEIIMNKLMYLGFDLASVIEEWRYDFMFIVAANVLRVAIVGVGNTSKSLFILEPPGVAWHDTGKFYRLSDRDKEAIHRAFLFALNHSLPIDEYLYIHKTQGRAYADYRLFQSIAEMVSQIDGEDMKVAIINGFSWQASINSDVTARKYVKGEWLDERFKRGI